MAPSVFDAGNIGDSDISFGYNGSGDADCDDTKLKVYAEVHVVEHAAAGGAVAEGDIAVAVAGVENRGSQVREDLLRVLLGGDGDVDVEIAEGDDGALADAYGMGLREDVDDLAQMVAGFWGGAADAGYGGFVPPSGAGHDMVASSQGSDTGYSPFSFLSH